MIAILLALGASAAYGSSDLVAAAAARRVRPIAIAWWGHVAGTGVLTIGAALMGGNATGGMLLLGALGGAVASVGLVLFYGALSRGAVSVVTPVAASGVAVPVVAGALRGEAPGPLAWVGLAIAAVSVLLVASSRQTDEEQAPACPGARAGCPDEQGARAPRLHPTVSALLSALAFGTAFLLIDAASTDGDGALWAAAGVQAGGLAGLVPILLGGPLRRVLVQRTVLGPIVAAGLLAATGDAALTLAFSSGALGVVSVLGSLDSVVSVLLAQVLLKERLAGRRAFGVVGALAGAALLATG